MQLPNRAIIATSSLYQKFFYIFFGRIFNLPLVHLISVRRTRANEFKAALEAAFFVTQDEGRCKLFSGQDKRVRPFLAVCHLGTTFGRSTGESPVCAGTKERGCGCVPRTLGGVATIRACPMKSPSRQHRARQLHCLTADKLSWTHAVLGSVERTGNKKKRN